MRASSCCPGEPPPSISRRERVAGRGRAAANRRFFGPDLGSDPSPLCVARSAVATPIEILADLSAERLRDVVEAAPRKVREELFRSAGIKTKSSTYSLRGGDKSARYARLKERLGGGDGPSAEAADEVVRSYLGQRSALLGHALDHFDVPHQQGFTDQDLDFLTELSPQRARELREALAQAGHEAGDVELYCRYMGVPGPG